MSIDHFHFVAKGEMPVEIARAEAATKLTEEAHTIYEMAGGIEHLYIFENGETAAALFERWRRQPVEKIVLTLEGVAQDWVGRLPLGTKPGDGCDMDVSSSCRGTATTTRTAIPTAQRGGQCSAVSPSPVSGGNDESARNT